MYLEGAALAGIELDGAEVVAESVDLSGPEGLADAEPGEPLLVQHRIGEGVGYLLTTRRYPAPHVPAFMTDVLRTIINAEQGDIALEGQLVSYAVYDDMAMRDATAVVYAANMSFYDQPQVPTLIVRGRRVPLRVESRGLRIAWVGRRLLVSPHDPMVRVDDMATNGDVCEVALSGERGRHRVQLDGLDSDIAEARLDDRRLRLQRSADGGCFVSVGLTQGDHRLHVQFAE